MEGPAALLQICASTLHFPSRHNKKVRKTYVFRTILRGADRI